MSQIAAWVKTLYRNDWVVYVKPPFGGPAQVLKYLARYTHRVAISNGRLVNFEQGRVTFRYKDYADDSRHKSLTLDAVEFLRRFVQHVLPKGFVKIRHGGLLGNRHRAERLELCRRLLFVTAAREALLSTGVPFEWHFYSEGLHGLGAPASDGHQPELAKRIRPITVGFFARELEAPVP